MQVFRGIILAIAYRGCIFSSFLRFDPTWLRVLRCLFSSWFGVGGGGTLCFVSFHFLASCSVAGKMQVFLPTSPSGGLFAFSGDWLVPSKPKLP